MSASGRSSSSPSSSAAQSPSATASKGSLGARGRVSPSYPTKKSADGPPARPNSSPSSRSHDCESQTIRLPSPRSAAFRHMFSRHAPREIQSLAGARLSPQRNTATSTGAARTISAVAPTVLSAARSLPACAAKRSAAASRCASVATKKRHGWRFLADGASLPASRTLRNMAASTGLLLKLRTLCRARTASSNVSIFRPSPDRRPRSPRSARPLFVRATFGARMANFPADGQLSRGRLTFPRAANFPAGG